MTRYHPVEAKTILRRHGQVDPWFVGRYGLNLYRGCEHGCLYCDGRAERYYVPGDFSGDIQIKTNAAALLRRELQRLPEPGFLFLGGGVSDSYQPAESLHALARQALEISLGLGQPVHVLTKSSLVERDLELLVALNEKKRAILSFSIASTNETIREHFEPGACSFSERWRLLERAKRLGLPTGVMAMPLLPGISDQPEHIDQLVARARDVGADFLLGGCLTLRPGVQKQSHMEAVQRHCSTLVQGYRRLYRDERRSGAPDSLYVSRVGERIAEALARYDLPGRIPRAVFARLIPCYREVAVLLEHRAFDRAGGSRAALLSAAAGIQQWASELLKRRPGRPRLDHQQLEQRFCQLVTDDTGLRHELGVPGSAAGVVRELVAACHVAQTRLAWE